MTSNKYTLSINKTLHLKSTLKNNTSKIIWTIKNFSMIDLKGSLESPTFSSEDGHYDWSLSFQPSNNTGGVFSVYLNRKSTNYTLPPLSYEMYILDSKNRKTKVYNSKYSSATGSSNFVSRTELSEKENELVPNDSLTIGCEMYALEDTIHCKTDEIEENKNNMAKLTSSSEQRLCGDLGQLLLKSNFTDLTIVVGEKKFQVHKAILAARSPVIEAMLKSEMKESKTNILNVENISADIMNDIICYIYTGRPNNLKEAAADLLLAADYYALLGLKDICAGELLQSLTVNNASKLLELGDLCNMPDFKEKVLEFILKNTREVFESESWKDLMGSKSHLIQDIFARFLIRNV